MKILGVNLIIDSIVATIGVTAVYLLGVAVPHYWLYIILGSYLLGAMFYIVPTEFREKRRSS